jgi:hypothetical protein
MKRKISLTESELISLIKTIIKESESEFNTVEDFIKKLKDNLGFNIKESWGDAYYRRIVGKNVIDVSVLSDTDKKSFTIKYGFYYDRKLSSMEELVFNIIDQIDDERYESIITTNKENVTKKMVVVDIEITDKLLPSEGLYKFIESQIKQINSTTI